MTLKAPLIAFAWAKESARRKAASLYLANAVRPSTRELRRVVWAAGQGVRYG